MGRIIVGCVVLAVLCIGLSYADVPSLMNYQGRLTDAGGAPVQGTKSMMFEFRDAPAAGNLLGGFSETQSVAVAKGLFNVLIGSATPGGVPQSIFEGSHVYLSVKVEGEELTPRQRIATVGYAFRAANADALEARVAALEALLAGASRNGNDITLSGVNLHINNGTGSTDGAVNGLGNLIVGYNELRGGRDDRSGSHNIVVGSKHNFTSYGGLVAGFENNISGRHASVTGGVDNTASRAEASVTAGVSNTASGAQASVTGGSCNEASGWCASVSGGSYHSVTGMDSWAAGN